MVRGHLVIPRDKIENLNEICGGIQADDYLDFIDTLGNSNFLIESIPIAIHLIVRTTFNNKVLVLKNKRVPNKEMTLSRNCLNVDTIGISYVYFLEKLKDIIEGDFEKLHENIMRNTIIQPLGISLNKSIIGERVVFHFVLYVKDKDIGEFKYKRNTTKTFIIEDIENVYDSNDLDSYALSVKDLMKIVTEQEGDIE